MPTIPSLDGPSVRTQALGAPQVQIVGSNQAAATAAITEGAGRLANNLVQREVERANNAALMDAEAKLSQHQLDLMFNKENGVYGQKGKSALDITNRTLPTFDQQAEQLMQGLSNTAQKDQFARIVNNQRQRLNQELNRYEFTQRNEYYDEVDQANVATSLDGAVKYANDPSQVAYYQAKGNIVIGEQAKRKGMSAESTLLAQQQFNSQVSLGVIERLATADPLKAQQYYAANAASMSGEAQIKVQALLGTAVRQQMAQGMAESAWNTGTPGKSSLPGLIMQAESNGDQTAVSPKGALGAMQLMPATAEQVAKQMGVPFSLERLKTDANYNMALGTEFVNQMIGRFNGNKTLAVAAYNAGPGMIEDWINGTNKTGKNDSKLKIGDPRTGEVSDAEFISKIPFKETRNYTSSIMSRYAQSSASPDQPVTSISQQYATGLKAINAIKDPKLRQYAEDHLNDLKKQADAQLGAYYDQAASYVNEGGFQTIPASLLNQLPADEQVKLRRLDDYRNKGMEPKTDYTKLESFLSMPAEQLASLSLAKDVQPYLSRADFNTVQHAWSKARTGDQTAQQIAAAKEKAVQTSMAMAGIVVSGDKKNKPDNLVKQQQFRDALQGRIDSFKQANNGKEPSVSDIEDLSNQLLLKVKIQGGGMVFGDATKELWEVQPEDLGKTFLDKGELKLENIPPSDRRQIIAALRAAGLAPTPEAIIANYQNRISGLGITVK